MIVVGGITSWIQENFVFLIQILASTFHCYKIVVAEDETI